MLAPLAWPVLLALIGTTLSCLNTAVRVTYAMAQDDEMREILERRYRFNVRQVLVAVEAVGVDHERAGVVGRWKFEDVFALFPNLAARQDNPAGVLSGGEQQMLTLCRTLMGDPDLIMIDEPTEGLAPKLVELVRGLLEKIAERGIVRVLLVHLQEVGAVDVAEHDRRGGERDQRTEQRRRERFGRQRGETGPRASPRSSAS